MGQRFNLYLIIIAALLAVVLFVDLSGSGSGLLNNNFKTQLGLDLRGGLRVLLEVDLPQDTPVTAQELEDAKSILEKRANELGVSEVVFQSTGARRIVGEFPGLTNTSQVISVLKEVGQLAFVPMGKDPQPEGAVLNVDLTQVGKPLNDILAQEPAAAPAAAAPTAASPASPTTVPAPKVYKAIMTGSDLATVNVSRDKVGKYAINFTLKDAGAKVFSEYTSAHVGDYLAIVLDNKVISDPVINGPITGGTGEITGNYTADSANALAIQLRYGSLPVPLKVVESRQVGATLGQDSITRSVRAGAIGLTMVILFMIILYRLPGVLASLALGLYALTTFALFKAIPVVLTLPGIAGFVLSIGVAVDANILIFERLKEELRSGRPLRQAVEVAWQRAWPSIRDSNITTLITCTILFWYGSSFGASIIKGFALTLALGVLVSLFTSIFVTRTFLHVTLDNLKFTEHPRWFNA